MIKISDALKNILSNPDDLSALPQLAEQVAALEEAEANYQNRISQLQEVNRKYLQMIPLPNDPEKPLDPPKPNWQDESKAFLNGLLAPKGE